MYLVSASLLRVAIQKERPLRSAWSAYTAAELHAFCAARLRRAAAAAAHPKKGTMRRVASAPSGNLRSGSILPLQRRDSPRMKPSPQRWARLSRQAPRLCGFLIVLLVIARTFVLPQAVRSERSEHPDAFHADKVSCPHWYDLSLIHI